jgi:hypothetical protein
MIVFQKLQAEATIDVPATVSAARADVSPTRPMETSVDRRIIASERSLPKPPGVDPDLRSQTDHNSKGSDRKFAASETRPRDSFREPSGTDGGGRAVPAMESPIVVADDVTRPPQSSVSDLSVDLPETPDPKTSPPSTVASLLPMPVKTPELRLNRTESGKRKTSLPGPDEKTVEPPKNIPVAASILQSPDRTDRTAASIVEEVALRQPQENRPVTQIEDLIAVTTARGFPVALVRSDLPDDYWWVQQGVGIQGNSFSARVNFGNIKSLPGTSYTLVFVFLDTQPEMHRFQLAKQFKELPEGLRRSREFRFVRNR